MGFKYVLIPASCNEPMQELEYDETIDDLAKDTFRDFLTSYFNSSSQEVDKSVLIKQLKDKTGVDLQANKSQMGEEAMNKLLASTSVEIFPVMLPTKDTGFEGFSAYCDDKGIAKNLEENPRASGVVQACGYPGQTFRGDVFMSRIFDDNEEQWRREDFTLKDCSTDAAWVKVTQKQRSNRASASDMSDLAAKVGARNPARINPDMMQVDLPGGETDQYQWRQTATDVEITFKLGLQKGDTKQIKVNFLRQKLVVNVKGQVIFDSPLCHPISNDDSTWTLSDGVLEVSLSKGGDETWASLTKA